MFPERTMSSKPVRSDMLFPDNMIFDPLIDYEMGGIALSDPTEGLYLVPWKVWAENGVIYIDKLEGGAQEVLVYSDASRVAFTFDQNMFPVLAYTIGEDTHLRWYDPMSAQVVTSNFKNYKNLKLTLDDKRPAFIASSDAIFCYSFQDTLYYRVQRERYLIAHEVGPVPANKPLLYSFGKNRGNRVQISFREF